MTLAAEAAKAVAAEKYKIAAVTSNERYWNNRAASIAADADAGRGLVVAGAVPVTAENSAVAPAGGGVNHFTPAPAGNVTVARGPHGPRETRTASGPAPLAAANVDAWIADESRFDPEGVAALQREWGNDLGANLGYVKSWLHTTFTPEQREQAEAANILSVPVIRFIAQIAREGAHGAPTTTTTTTMRGPPPMSDESRPDALKRFRRLTSELHGARARMDHLRARELADERDALSQALFPGDTSPGADTSGHQVG